MSNKDGSNPASAAPALSIVVPKSVSVTSCFSTRMQRWPGIRSAGLDSGRILRFSSGPEVTFKFRQQQESAWSYKCHFLNKNMGELRLHRLQPESEQELDSQIWKIFGPGLKNYGTGTESETVTPATSARMRQFRREYFKARWYWVRLPFSQKVWISPISGEQFAKNKL